MKKVILLTALATSFSVNADQRFYTEYKNDMVFIDNHYLDNSARNNIRFGVQGDIFYFEAGTTEMNSEVGASYEAGYKYKFGYDKVEIKGKLEGYQFDNYEGSTSSKFETEVRYYFN